jgi:glyoxylate/hydroxypyruvate reductase
MIPEPMVFYSTADSFDDWRAALVAENIDLRRDGDIKDKASVRHALVWKPPHGRRWGEARPVGIAAAGPHAGDID